MTIVQTVYASGKVMADSEYTVGTLISGTVDRKLVQEGDQVRKGQVIYILRHTSPAAKMEAANSALRNATENISVNSRLLNDLKIAEQNAGLKFTNDSLLYRRYQNLWAQNIGTQVNRIMHGHSLTFLTIKKDRHGKSTGLPSTTCNWP
ncbi:efflux RND transporter periplasmic adaptor subunit [Mucilaginibacter humi]|uniref:biotin/lipoyl-binding protein n=1 Tax=Mucilaginibacter humi TaxID=2732510 RepID=UPI001FE8D105|nr:biotin/lipoyl-binding protein [Mucilaginibacter humi]